MRNQARRHTVTLVIMIMAGLVLVETVGLGSAAAGGNDLVLRRLATREVVTDANGTALGFNAFRDKESFDGISRDLGLIFAPKFLSPAETLGEAGFDAGISLSATTVGGAKDYWRALEGSDCRIGNGACEAYDPGAFLTGQIHVRKGLPFSFELGGTLSHLFDSDLIALGTEIKWALNEGFFVLPDLAVRGAVNNVVGSSDLNLTTGGVNVSMSKSFGVAGMVNITPYVGYNRVFIFASSRLLDVAPEDPRLPTVDENGDLEFQPEFCVQSKTQQVDRFFGGFRFIFVHAVVTLETVSGGDVTTYSGKVGFDF